MYTYHATVKKIVDGDTFDLTIDLGFKMHADIRVRLKNFDAPETYRPSNVHEKVHAQECVDYIHEVMPVDSIVLVKTEKTGKYGRWLADISLIEEGGHLDLVQLLKFEGFEKRKEYI